jgi:uncharacterized membrane protein
VALIGRLHPLLIHFPIALVLMALVAESAAIATSREGWHLVAIANIRVGAACACIAAIAGWRLALAPGIEAAPVLEWHRWLGTLGAGATMAAALATVNVDDRSPLGVWVYRMVLFGAAALVGVAGHLGGLLVWGADFLRP